MIVTRWQAPVFPSAEQVKMIFEGEGLAPAEDILPAGAKVTDRRLPFGEVRMVISGALVMNVSGNQILLRSGDRIELPSNTKHSQSVNGDEACVCVVAQKPF
jgi:quercetin dioxygenase-like cupin family protein